MQNCFMIPALAAALAGAAWAESAVAARSIVRADARTGRLVRSVVVQPRVIAPKVVSPTPVDDKGAPPASRKPEALPDGAAITEIIEHTARKYNVDSNLVHAVVKVESNYNPLAVSTAGAEGLMQLIPSTARRFGTADSFDARQNVEGGVRYLKYLQMLYGNDMRRVLAAYNAGEAAVEKFRGIPRYRETQNYVLQVGRRWGELNRARKAAPAPKAQPAAQAPAGAVKSDPEHRPLETVVDAEGKIHFRTK